MLGRVTKRSLEIRPIARFANGPVKLSDGLHWDLTTLYSRIKAGISTALRYEPDIRSVGVDSWAVDYALLRDGHDYGEPFHYRDGRNVAAAAAVHLKISLAELYAINGLQYLPFNSLYQLTADRLAGRVGANTTALLIPDLINYWLTGEKHTERTNASTTGLLNVSTQEWDAGLFSRLNVPLVFPPLVDAGVSVGRMSPSVAATLGTSRSVSVTTVGSHDTASAVVAIPSTRDDFAYISCGTWGLVGVELESPVLTESSRLANFTNEGGVDGRVRYLHNVMGLWLLSESVRTWERGGAVMHLPDLIAEAAAVSTRVPTFDPNDQRFLSPGDMPTRIEDWCRERGGPSSSVSTRVRAQHFGDVGGSIRGSGSVRVSAVGQKSQGRAHRGWGCTEFAALSANCGSRWP